MTTKDMPVRAKIFRALVEANINFNGVQIDGEWLYGSPAAIRVLKRLISKSPQDDFEDS